MRTIHNRLISEPFVNANFNPHPTDPLTLETFIAIDGLAISIFGDLDIGNLGDAHAVSIGEGRDSTIELYRGLVGRNSPELTVRSYVEGEEDYVALRLRKHVSPILQHLKLGASRVYFTDGFMSNNQQLTDLQVRSFMPVIQIRKEEGTFVDGSAIDL